MILRFPRDFTELFLDRLFFGSQIYGITQVSRILGEGNWAVNSGQWAVCIIGSCCFESKSILGEGVVEFNIPQLRPSLGAKASVAPKSPQCPHPGEVKISLKIN